MRDLTNRRPPRRGFTLIEMMIVMVIISIIVFFVLTAGAEGVRNAEIRATQGLISKLNIAMAERMEALLNTRMFVNDAHGYLAGIPNPLFVRNNPSEPPLLLSPRRAEAIARIEMFKMEVPDVWFPQNDANYPVNCAGVGYPWPPPNGTGTSLPGTSLRGSTYDPFVLPMGAAINDDPFNGSFGATPLIGFTGPGIPTESGIFGASHAARAGLLKNLGYLAKGYDGVDNDGNGFIDELAEGDDGTGVIQQNLASHKHVTARSEALFALLVEGRGPLASVFTRDDFTSKEVQDTDGDGLPEFVDAWGQPLQFYRWPVYYHSDSQKGTFPYTSATFTSPNIPLSIETREKASLDPNSELMAPAWWANIAGTDPTAPSDRAQIFGASFFTLFEFNFSPTAPAGTLWDRQGVYGRRREYYTKYLIVSSGPDQALGLVMEPDLTIRGTSVQNILNKLLGDFQTFPFTANPPPAPGESWAVPLQVKFPLIPNTAGEDDLSSHLLDLPGGGAAP